MQLRDNHSKRYPNTWCFPGGTIEIGESPIKTVVREIQEEYSLDINMEDCKPLMTYALSYGVSCQVYRCHYFGSEAPVLKEGADMKWMKLEEIKNLNLGFEQSVIVDKLDHIL